MSRPDLPPPDLATRFLFEDADIRGETVRLGQACRDITSIHAYPPGVSRQLGEFLAAAVLLSANLKFRGKLILQVRGGGQVPLLMAECSSDLAIRGLARGAAKATAEDFRQLLGDGQLAITVDPERGERYQGIVALDGVSLADSLEAYFRQSEQLGSRLWLASDGASAAGLLLQQLPEQVTTDAPRRQQQWEHACALAGTLRPDELLGLSTRDLLFRLYHEEAVRLFEPRPVAFRCSCSRERTLAALRSLPAAELDELLRELGGITMDCEFCHQQYRFGREDLADVLGEQAPPTLH